MVSAPIPVGSSGAAAGSGADAATTGGGGGGELAGRCWRGRWWSGGGVEAVAVPVPALPAPERWSLRSRCFMRDMNGGEVASGAARVLPAGSNPIQHSTARLKLIRGGDERGALGASKWDGGVGRQFP